jgi:hypothetical protein
LLESKANRDFFPLMVEFVPQKTQSYCGMASSVMVLNALPIAAPMAPGQAPFHAYTQDNLFNDEARRLGVAHGGLTLASLAALLQTQPARATIHYASDLTVDEFRRIAVANLERGGDYIILNWLRSAAGQEPTDAIARSVGGHFSPLAAYNEGSDRFLILDVNRWKYPPVWIEAKRLFDAMNTIDVDSGKTRGFLEVTAAPNAAPPTVVRGPRNRLLYGLGGIVAISFALGFGTSSLVRRLRRRA